MVGMCWKGWTTIEKSSPRGTRNAEKNRPSQGEASRQRADWVTPFSIEQWRTLKGWFVWSFRQDFLWGIFAAEARHAIEVDEMAVLVVDIRFVWPHPACLTLLAYQHCQVEEKSSNLQQASGKPSPKSPATEGIGSCGPVFFHYATGVDLEFTLRAADVVEKQAAGRVKWCGGHFS